MIFRQSITDQNELRLVFNDIRTCKTLSNAEIKALQDEGRYDIIMRHNMKFAVSMVKCYVGVTGNAISISDLVTEASLAILDAAKLFDASLNYTFTTFAVNYVRKYINDFLTAHGRTVRLTDRALRQKTDYSAVSMDAPTSEDEHLTIGDTFSGDFHADNIVQKADKHTEVMLLLRRLTERERYILINSFGIGCREKHQSEIAHELGLTEERVRQLKHEAINKLKGLI